jgi:hypothetical protein
MIKNKRLACKIILFLWKVFLIFFRPHCNKFEHLFLYKISLKNKDSWVTVHIYEERNYTRLGGIPYGHGDYVSWWEES